MVELPSIYECDLASLDFNDMIDVMEAHEQGTVLEESTKLIIWRVIVFSFFKDAERNTKTTAFHSVRIFDAYW